MTFGSRAAVATLLVVTLSTAACGSYGPHGPDSSAVDPFADAALSQLTSLRSITLWRVGRQAAGPGRHPDESMPKVAALNGASWAFSVDGDARYDSSRLDGVAAEAPTTEAQDAVVRLVESATGHSVTARWREVDVDTWTASASFAR